MVSKAVSETVVEHSQRLSYVEERITKHKKEINASLHDFANSASRSEGRIESAISNLLREMKDINNMLIKMEGLYQQHEQRMNYLEKDVNETKNSLSNDLNSIKIEFRQMKEKRFERHHAWILGGTLLFIQLFITAALNP